MYPEGEQEQHDQSSLESYLSIIPGQSIDTLYQASLTHQRVIVFGIPFVGKTYLCEALIDQVTPVRDVTYITYDQALIDYQEIAGNRINWPLETWSDFSDYFYGRILKEEAESKENTLILIELVGVGEKDYASSTFMRLAQDTNTGNITSFFIGVTRLYSYMQKESKERLALQAAHNLLSAPPSHIFRFTNQVVRLAHRLSQRTKHYPIEEADLNHFLLNNFPQEERVFLRFLLYYYSTIIEEYAIKDTSMILVNRGKSISS